MIAENLSYEFPSEFRVIGDTPAGSFLNNERNLLREVLAKALDQEPGSDVVTAALDKPGGLWSTASINLATTAEGNVIAITPDGVAGSVFADDELKTLIDLDKVPSINGIPLEELKGLLPEEQLSRVNGAANEMMEHVHTSADGKTVFDADFLDKAGSPEIDTRSIRVDYDADGKAAFEFDAKMTSALKNGLDIDKANDVVGLSTLTVTLGGLARMGARALGESELSIPAPMGLVKPPFVR